MGKGAGRGRKPQRGGHRQFTDVETLKRQTKELEGAKKQEDSEEEEEEEEEDAVPVNRQGAVGELPPTDSESEASDDDEAAGDKTKKGAAAPTVEPISNRAPVKGKKIDSLTLESLEVNEDKRGLNRKDREALEKEEAKKRYQALTAAGKTDQAKADMARLAIIRKQREEAAKKREEEQKAKDAAAAKAKKTNQP